MVTQENEELGEETEEEKNAYEFADKIRDGLKNLKVKVMTCILIKKSSSEKPLMWTKSIMMFSMIDVSVRNLKYLLEAWTMVIHRRI